MTVSSAGPSTPDKDEDDALLERLAARVVRWGMGVPAVFFLESIKPLNFVGSQALIFFSPIVSAFFRIDEYDRLAQLLASRETLERLIRKIERLLDEQETERRRPGPP